ncbi:peptidylprolyl isomerase [Moheibacter lacus]|uniref:Peptidylprolyl isomerase n=1 Tax=Moheibacter lacus TaxID=2745851 RepID=A0A838ZPZ7_9FLAO|nr:peptidylprolyl isomerase [Moheibacter lacus]MBA5629697.1 peptidylprolyl isomerase [Moheibacter lacus]
MKIKLYVLLSVFSTLSVLVSAQPTQNNPSGQLKLDGVAAVVGGEVILDSDIERDYVQAKMQGYEVENECDFLENILVDKLLLTKAKEDTLVIITNDQVERRVDGTIQRFLTQGSEKEILEYFGYTTMPEFRQELVGIMRDQAFAERKQELITQGMDATPEEVRTFYEQYSSELPDIPEEVSLDHIVVYPEISPENEQKVIDDLAGYKKEIEEGASFATKAILYSNDPGSSSNGGLIENVKRGQMVPEFDAVVFNLQEGEISDPFKTEFGYHIAQLEKRRGQELDIRHILVQLKPTPEEIAITRQKLDSIILKVETGEMTFKEAAFRYSVDKYTKFNGGRLVDNSSGEDKMDRTKLPANVQAAISGLEDGEISQPFEDEFQRQPVLRVIKLQQTIPAHKINIEADYARLKNLTINTKRQETVMKWVGEQINDTFITIDSDYDKCDFRLNWRKTE